MGRHEVPSPAERGGEKKKSGNGFLIALICFFLLTFLISGALMGRELIEGMIHRGEFKELTKKVDESAPAAESLPESGDTDAQGRPFKVRDNRQRFAALLFENPDFAGWLRIDDPEETKIDFPVMCTPDDPEYYLHRNFERRFSDYGVPFMGDGCTIHSNNIFIYGHTMLDDAMFSPLHNYEQEEYWQTHKTLHFDTTEYSGLYEILAVYAETVHLQDETDVFRFYNYSGDLNPEEFADYVRQAKEAAFYDTGVDAEYGDMLLSLITCSYHAADGRLVVVAKRVE